MNKTLLSYLGLFSMLTVLLNCTSEIPSLKSPKNAQKNILTFKFADINPVTEGDIDTTLRTVKIRVPVATKVITLIPTISVSNEATINPNSLVVQNFTNPVTYMVTAADCTKRAFLVTVDVARTTDPEISGIETLTAKTTEQFFIYGKNLSRTGAVTTFILTSKTTGKTFNLKNISLAATQVKVQIPFEVPVGLYSITVDVSGRQFKYRTLDLKITGDGTVLNINRMTVLSYIRGDKLIITGNNIKATKAQIRFQPQTGGTVTQTKDAVINPAGTEVSYVIEPTFPAPYNWTLTLLLDGQAYALNDIVRILVK
jgi:hypothetical protein